MKAMIETSEIKTRVTCEEHAVDNNRYPMHIYIYIESVQEYVVTTRHAENMLEVRATMTYAAFQIASHFKSAGETIRKCLSTSENNQRCKYTFSKWEE